ncbi:MAG TPA: D-aminoacylase [Chthonomonadaceae bacterium]|nr:D-aminoacylase [Chthonomonadaceae bacterium]
MRKLLGGLAIILMLGLGVVRPSAQEGERRPASILIVGGTVVDGTGAHGRRADVRVLGDTIQEIGKLAPQPGERVIDARGLVVAPGFIDTHSHADAGLLEKPEAESQIRQGITTVIVGQDGGSHFPLQMYFEQVQAKHIAPNLASFVGHGTVRSRVLGTDYKRHATPEEEAKMAALVDQEMQAGALGLSSGLEYDPGFYATTEEVIACAREAGKYGGLYISHVRNEDNQAFQSFRELIRIAEEGHLPAQISHIKLGSKNVWGKAPDVLRLMQEADRRGLDITADVYPYLYWQSTITALVPTRDWENRAIWEKGLADVGGPEHVLLTTYTPDPAWAGKTIAALSAQTGKDPVTVIQEVVRHTHGKEATGREGVVVTAMSEDDLRTFLKAPRIMFCSDGVPGGSHPRGAGTYPRILGRYVREYHVLRLEEAIHKASALPAWRMGFADRGLIKTGMKADIVLFDPKTVIDMATTANPTAPPVGLPYVLVNGVVVLDNGKMTGERPGMVLRRRSVQAAPIFFPR